MSDAAKASADGESVSRAARRKLVPVLGTLKRHTTPHELLPAAGRVAEAMGQLHEYEQGESAALGRALEALRAALDVMQAAPTAFDDLTSQLAEALLLAHSLSELPRPEHHDLGGTTRPDVTQRSAGQSVPPRPAEKPTRVDERPARGQRPLAKFMYGVAANVNTQTGIASTTPRVEVVLGMHSASNFYSGFDDGDLIEHGGLFVADLELREVGEPVRVNVSLPGGHAFDAWGVVSWHRPPRADGTHDPQAPPGYGIKFTRANAEARALVRRYVRTRRPLFFER